MSANIYTSLAICLSLAACGGGGDDNSAAPATTLPASGTAAYGAALANADIIVKGKNGLTLSTRADTNGKWTIADISKLTAPFIIQAKGNVGGTEQVLYSVVATQPTGAVTANITPLTSALLNQATGLDPALIFADPAKIAAINANKVDSAKAKLITALSDYMSALGVDTSKVDFVSTAFEANNKGLDKLMDLVKVSASGTGETTAITVKDKATGEAVEFKPADTPKKLSKPSAETQNLNLTKIRELIAQFNLLGKTQEGIMSADYAALWDDEFLDSGVRKAEDIADLRAEFTKNPAAALKMTLLDIQGCEKNICKLKISLENAKGLIETTENSPVRQGADGKWRLFGNQKMAWPVSAYRVHGFKNTETLSTVQSASSTSGSLSVGGQSVTLNGTSSDTLTVQGWAGSWSHKVDYRAIMLCAPVSNAVNPANTGKYILLANNSQAAILDDLKNKTFEHNEGCGAKTSTVSVNSNAQIAFANSAPASVQDSAAAFSATGLDTGKEIIYLKAYKVFYPDGKYWYVVVEHSVVKADPSQSYVAWWKQTAPVNP